jgi:hypothetical protein
MTGSPATRGTAASRVVRRWAKPILGLALLAIILFAGPFIGWVTAGGKISPEIDRGASRVNIVVELSDTPTAFHRETLSDFGVYAGRDRNQLGEPRLVLRNVPQSSLDRLTGFYWIKTIEPMQ